MKLNRFKEEFPFQLDIDYWELSESDCDLLMAANMLQEYHQSIRECARNNRLSKSVFYRFLKHQLRDISYELWDLCESQLKWNSQHSDSFKKK